MNKKGMTLVEVMAVIAILGILAIITTPAIIAIRKRVLTTLYESKINTINNAAKDYAEKNLVNIPSPVSSEISNILAIDETKTNDCLIIFVRSLIDSGYLSGDSNDKSTITNPLTNESLNNKRICIRYNTNNAMNRQIVTYIIEEN